MRADGPRLRASPAYELVPYERLSSAARRRHAALLGEADFYGLLRARGRAARVVDRESALLLHTLREPGPLPAYLGRGRAAAAALAALRALVLDGVIEVAAGGRFASGAAALALLDAAQAPPAARGRPAELSAAALRLGAALVAAGAGEVARRLYAFNREPLTPARRRAVPNDSAARRALGLAPGAALARRIGRDWRGGAGGGAWTSWFPRRAAPAPAGRTRGVKLYVSPVADDLPGALDALVAALAATGPVPFKVARRPDGLLRPDKLVAYFPSLDPLRRAAARLEPALRGLRAQGVPFTAAVTEDGLLSWGADPPDRALGSWRAWLCGRLAEHLVDASRAGVRDPAAEATRRVAADGVDPATWAPVGA